MAHLNDGVLRRLHDDALSVTGAARRHYDGCPDCQARLATIAADARAAADALRLPELQVDAHRALAELRPRLAQPAGASGLLARLRGPLERRPLALGMAGGLALVLALAVGIAAANLQVIFAPKTIRAVPVSLTDFQGLPDLAAYGTSTSPSLHPEQVASAEEARTRTGLRPVVPGSLPAGVPNQVHYAVASNGQGSFTFSAAKAQEAAARVGKTPPPMPAGMDGSTLVVKMGPAVVQVYGNLGTDAADSRTAASDAAPDSMGMPELPPLVIAQARTPTVSSSGVSTKELEDYLLQQPGISKHLADQIRAIGDPSTTLAVPIPEGLPSHSVTVQGVPGIFVGDSSGLGSAVVWVKSGQIFAVGGTLGESQVMSVANSLH